jgi:hypothetical protein
MPAADTSDTWAASTLCAESLQGTSVRSTVCLPCTAPPVRLCQNVLQRFLAQHLA